ncbi:MAG: hypothetical protein AAGH42_01765 [Pseudomonadota bacterium]
MPNLPDKQASKAETVEIAASDEPKRVIEKLESLGPDSSAKMVVERTEASLFIGPFPPPAVLQEYKNVDAEVLSKVLNWGTQE